MKDDQTGEIGLPLLFWSSFLTKGERLEPILVEKDKAVSFAMPFFPEFFEKLQLPDNMGRIRKKREKKLCVKRRFNSCWLEYILNLKVVPETRSGRRIQIFSIIFKKSNALNFSNFELAFGMRHVLNI